MQSGAAEVRHPPFSGPANHVRRVCTELSDLGHQVRLLTLLEGQILKSDDLEHFEPVSVRWLDKAPLRLFEKLIRRVQFELRLPYADFFESLRFALACSQELAGYDIFFERMGWFGYGGGIAAKCLDIPLILEVNGDHLSELDIQGIRPQGIQRWLSIKLMRSAVNRCSFVVATGEGWQQRFIERWEISSDIITVVENGTDIVDMLSRDQLRAFSFEEDSDSISVVYVGAFEAWHGLDILVKAISAANAHGIQVSLVLIGSGIKQREIEQLIEERDLWSKVSFTGHLPVDKLALYLAQADIGVSPYCGRVEYSGLKLFDYKGAGLPIIASGENGQPLVVEHFRNGLIIPPCDKNALCEAIIFLATNPMIRRALGQAARIDAEQHHRWQHTAHQLVRVFEKVLTY